MLKVIAAVLFIGCMQAQAQALQHKIIFYKGQQFEKTITGSATTTMRRGKQVLELVTTSLLTKVFNVKNVTAAGYNFGVTVTRVQNKMRTQGKEIQYDSDGPQVDTGNGTAANGLVKKMNAVIVDTAGLIYQADTITGAANTGNTMREILVNYTAVPQTQVTGSSFELLPYFNFKGLKKNETWVDSTADDEITQVLKYTVTENTGPFITVLFAGDIVRIDSSSDDGIAEKSRIKGKISGEMKINTGLGIIESKTTHCEMAGITDIMGIKLATTTNSTITEAVASK